MREVGPNTTGAEAEDIARVESAKAAEAARTANGLDAQMLALNSGDETENVNGAPSGAPDPEAGVYGSTLENAVMGSSATLELIKFGVGKLTEVKTNDLGGMEKPVKPSAPSGKKVSIHTGAHCRDLFSDAANASESINGESKIKGAKADQGAALLKARNACNVLQKTAEHKAGLAVKKGADLGAEAHKATQGMAPGGNTQQMAHLNHTHDAMRDGPKFREPIDEGTT